MRVLGTAHFKFFFFFKAMNCQQIMRCKKESGREM